MVGIGALILAPSLGLSANFPDDLRAESAPLRPSRLLVGGYKLVDANKQAIAYVYAMPIRAMPLGAGTSEEEYNEGG